MARPRKQPLPTITKTPPVQTLPDGRLKLSPSAEAFYHEVSSKWVLTPPVENLLRLICEARTLSESCDEVLTREGLHCGDAKGSLKVHPLLAMSRDLRNSAAQNTHRLLAHLG